MELVIKLDDETYKQAINRTEFDTLSLGLEVIEAVQNGTPLPKEHGRLIDGDKVLDDIEKKYPASVSETEQSKRYARLVYYWAVKNAPTIIEGSDADEDSD